ncbi:MAG: Pup amidohydrolase [Patescibacteria group bacterium]|nr:Pup amidohydrolase [Patescibacteria group bacterium]
MENGELGYTVEDYHDGIPPRAFGTETEYTDNSDIERFIDDYIHGGKSRRLGYFVNPRYMVTAGRSEATSVITSNGGEMYLDSATLEYATPECRTPTETTLHERIGELIVNDTVQQIGRWRDVPTPKVYKRGGYITVWGDSRGAPLLRETSIGHHENYSSRSNLMQMGQYDLERDPAFRFMNTFLVLRKLIDGAGMVAEDHFSITQKPRAINYCALESSTMHGKKKPFQQKEDRLEIRTGEGNKSDWANTFKIGLTSLVLRLMEHKQIPKDMNLYDPNVAIAQIAQNPLSAVTLASGERMRGIDVLSNIVESAYDLAKNYDEMPEYEKQAYADFVEFYDDIHKINLRQHDVSSLSDRIDWAARYAFLVRTKEYNGLFTTDNLKLVQYDLLWDQIGDHDIARKWFSKFGHTALTATIALPPPTRAQARVELIRDLDAQHKFKYASWGSVNASDGTIYDLRHPLLPVYQARPEAPIAPNNRDWM